MKFWHRARLLIVRAVQVISFRILLTLPRSEDALMNSRASPEAKEHSRRVLEEPNDSDEGPSASKTRWACTRSTDYVAREYKAS